MDSETAFVGRNDELLRACEMIENAEKEGGVLSVVGPGGHGKSRFLSEIESEYTDSEEVYVLEFTFNKNIVGLRRFAQEFHDKFADEVPTKRIQRALNGLRNVLSSSKLEGLFDLAAAGGSVTIPALSLLSPAKHALPDEGETSEEDFAAYSNVVVDFLDQFAKKNPDTTLVLLFDEYHHIPSEKKPRFDRLFHGLGSSIPSGVVSVVASRSRDLCEEYDSPIEEVELGELSKSDIGEYLTKQGFDPQPGQISEVVELTQGNPYWAFRFVQLAEKRGLQQAIDRVPEDEKQGYLEDAFLDQLESDEESFLRDVSGLPELRPDIISEILPLKKSEARKMLKDLHRKTVLQRTGVHQGYPVYQMHEFLLSHLQTTTNPERIDERHYDAAMYYLEKLDSDPLTESMYDLLWSMIADSEPSEGPLHEFAEEIGEIMAAGSMFHYHLEETTKNEEMEVEIASLIQDPQVDAQQVMASLHVFYSNNPGVDLGKVRENVSIDTKNETEPFSDKVVDRTEVDDDPYAQLALELIDGFRIANQEEVDETEISELKDIQERTKELSDEEGLEIIAGGVHVALTVALGHHLKQFGQEEKAEKQFDDAKRFVREKYGLGKGDLDFMKEMLRGLSKKLEVTGPTGIELSDKDDVVESRAMELGAYGGVEEGVADMVVELFQEFNKVREEQQELAHDGRLYRKAGREIAIYFEERGNPSVAAIFRDIGDMIYFGMTDETIDREEFSLAFEASPAFEQLNALSQRLGEGDDMGVELPETSD